MKIGYPCINSSIECTSNSTFRLSSYSDELLEEKIRSNLNCLKVILGYNLDNGFLFFRIGSQLVPFASHEVCKLDWKKRFRKDFEDIGRFALKNKMRLSMHPGQYTVLNSPDKKIVRKAVGELDYHVSVLDMMKLPPSHKVQVHVGGVYGEKENAMERFVKNYKKLPKKIKNRLVIENDHKMYSLRDCLTISKRTGAPIVFDIFHHYCLNNGEGTAEAMRLAKKTWKKKDGDLMMDYSSQARGKPRGSHSTHVSMKDFSKFISESKKSNVGFDLMLEIKDKEKSALEIIRSV